MTVPANAWSIANAWDNGTCVELDRSLIFTVFFTEEPLQFTGKTDRIIPILKGYFI